MLDANSWTRISEGISFRAFVHAMMNGEKELPQNLGKLCVRLNEVTANSARWQVQSFSVNYAGGDDRPPVLSGTLRVHESKVALSYLFTNIGVAEWLERVISEALSPK